MYGQGDVNGNILARFIRIHLASSGQVADPGTASGEVLGVVIRPGYREVRLGAGPLHPVEGAFKVTGHSGRGVAVLRRFGNAARSLAHAAANLHGISRDHASVRHALA